MKLLYALVFASASIAIYCQLNQLDSFFYVFKPLTTILIITTVIRFANKQASHYYTALLLGLIACLFGDVFLLNNDYFVAGLGSFLLGHLLFLYAFVSRGGVKLYPFTLLVLTVIATSFYFYLLPSLGDFAIPVAIYNTVIVLMAWQGVNLVLWENSLFSRCVSVAAILFMVSDSVIALDKFIMPLSWSSAVILPLYWLSISMLSYSSIVIQTKTAGSKNDTN